MRSLLSVLIGFDMPQLPAPVECMHVSLDAYTLCCTNLATSCITTNRTAQAVAKLGVQVSMWTSCKQLEQEKQQIGACHHSI